MLVKFLLQLRRMKILRSDRSKRRRKAVALGGIVGRETVHFAVCGSALEAREHRWLGTALRCPSARLCFYVLRCAFTNLVQLTICKLAGPTRTAPARGWPFHCQTRRRSGRWLLAR